LVLYTVSVTVPKAVLLRFAEHWCGAAETFKVDINNTVDLLKGETGQTIHERGIVVVGESGLFTPEDIALVQAAGVGAVSSLHFTCSGILWPQIHVNKIHFNPPIHLKNHRPNHEVF
jgi:hypothetical protein